MRERKERRCSGLGCSGLVGGPPQQLRRSPSSERTASRNRTPAGGPAPGDCNGGTVSTSDRGAGRPALSLTAPCGPPATRRRPGRRCTGDERLPANTKPCRRRGTRDSPIASAWGLVFFRSRRCLLLGRLPRARSTKALPTVNFRTQLQNGVPRHKPGQTRARKRCSGTGGDARPEAPVS